MRVLVVDQDSASNEAIVRSLREHYTVDAVTNKGDCLDLLRSNVFEVIVAAERLDDGSGLELLGQVGKKWPNVLRIFAAERERLKLLRGRLGPFELFQTLAYPIDPERLIATLNLAGAAQEAHADTSNIQHVVLSGEPPPEPDEIEEIEDSEESAPSGEEETENFPPPQRSARTDPAPRERAREHAAVATRRVPARIEPIPREESRLRGPAPQQAPRNGSAGPPATRETASIQTFPGSGTIRGPRHARSRVAANKPPPVRFPPLESPKDFATARAGGASDSFSEAAALARAARSNFEESTGELDTKRLAMIIGGGAAALLVLVMLGFKLFGSKSEAPRPVTPPVVKAPEYPREVTDLIGQTESALKADDFKAVRIDVDKLRRIAPSHPRLTFFDGLLAQHTDAAKPGANGSRNTTAKRNGKSKHTDPATTTQDSEPAASAAAHVIATPPTAAESSAPASAPATPASSPTIESAGLAPETPPGVTRQATGETAEATKPPSTDHSALSAAQAVPSAAAPKEPAGAPAAAAAEPATPPLAATAASPPARRAHSDEPPPVIREAKLIRRVDPDYPSAAKRDGVSGSVDLEVTVSTAGVVKDASVVRSNPADTFDKAALSAVRKWKYDPRFVDGLPAEAHLRVHLEFGPTR